MSTAIREQIRQLAAAFDEVVDDVSVEEVRGRVVPPGLVDELAHPTGYLLGIGPRPSARWLSIAAVWVLVVVGVIGALVWVERRGSAPSAAEPQSTTGTVDGGVVFG